MSLVPPFQIGVWNAWILMVLLFLAYVPGRLINKEAMSKMTTPVPFSRTESILWVFTHLVIIPFALIYSIFLPLKLGTEWFYVGLPICLLALLVNLMAGVSFATTPPDEPVTRGIYRVSRNPAYFGIFLMFIGIGIASAPGFCCYARRSG